MRSFVSTPTASWSGTRRGGAAMVERAGIAASRRPHRFSLLPSHLVPSRPAARSGVRGEIGLGGGVDAQPHPDGRAAAGLTLDAQEPAVGEHQMLDDRQSESCPAQLSGSGLVDAIEAL